MINEKEGEVIIENALDGALFFGLLLPSAFFIFIIAMVIGIILLPPIIIGFVLFAIFSLIKAIMNKLRK